MEPHDTPHHPENFLRKLSRVAHRTSTSIAVASTEHMDIIRREASIFAGLALFLIGIFNFHAGRYCDGNAADYLSCTRPAVYYYYGVFEITIIVLGAFFIAIWFLKPRRK